MDVDDHFWWIVFPGLPSMGMDHFDGWRKYVNPYKSFWHAYGIGVYLEGDGHDIKAGDAFHAHQTYLIHQHNGEWAPLKYRTESGLIKEQQFGPKAFGALFFLLQDFMDFTF